MTINYLTISRREFYELVWSNPMIELARRFGVSDVALAKRCRAVNVPVPPRGYWARVAAGQVPPKTPLPMSRPRGDDAIEPLIKVPQRTVRANVPLAAPLAPGESVVANLADGSIDGLLPAVKRTARLLRHPERALLTFERGTAHGPVLKVNVSDALLDRALRFADLLLRAAEGQGWAIVAPPLPQARSDGYNRQPDNPAPSGPSLGAIRIGDELIRFEIEERIEVRRLPAAERERARQTKNPYHHPKIRTETIPSGVLRLVRPALPYPYFVSRKSWYDRSQQRLETKIEQILQDFAQTAAVVKAKREEIRRMEREKAEVERLRVEEQKRRAANSRFIAELERQAGAWEYARRIRRYVRAAKRVLGERKFIWTFQDQPVDFFAWAENYIDEIDPLHPRPLHSDRTPDRPLYGGISEATVRKIVGRWFNRDEYVPHHVVLEARDPMDRTPPEGPELTQSNHAEDKWEE